jgi:hypothetical protein
MGMCAVVSKCDPYRSTCKMGQTAAWRSTCSRCPIHEMLGPSHSDEQMQTTPHNPTECTAAADSSDKFVQSRDSQTAAALQGVQVEITQERVCK